MSEDKFTGKVYERELATLHVELLKLSSDIRN
jgi:hypothetical protein